MYNLIVKILFLSAIAYSCNHKTLNQIKREEKLSSFASITADSDFFKASPPYLQKEPEIHFLYNSLYGLDQNSVFLQKGEVGKIFIARPTVVWCQQINIPLILYPGEKIKLQREEFGNEGFEISSEQRKKEIQVLIVLDDLTNTNLPGDYPISQYLTLETASSLLKYDTLVTRQLNNRRESIRAKIDSSVRSGNISPEFQREATNYLFAKIFTFKVDYFSITKKYYLSINPPGNRFTELISFSNSIKSHDELKYYYGPLRELAKQLAYSNSNGDISRVIDLKSLHFFLKIIKGNFYDLVKDFLIADILYTALKNKIISIDIFKEYYESDCDDRTYKLVLREIARTARTLERYAVVENGIFLFPLSSATPVSEDKLFDRYKGKLVLVDFWASWCIPCRQELPLMRELKRQYTGKDIVFLTISIDKKLSEAQKASNTERLTGEDNFVLNSNDSGFVFKGHRIENIPRYLLFNKDGSLIDANAPSPGNHSLKEMIDKYLH